MIGLAGLGGPGWTRRWLDRERARSLLAILLFKRAGRRWARLAHEYPDDLTAIPAATLSTWSEQDSDAQQDASSQDGPYDCAAVADPPDDLASVHQSQAVAKDDMKAVRCVEQYEHA